MLLVILKKPYYKKISFETDYSANENFLLNRIRNQKILVIGFIAALFLIAWFSFISKVETKINNASEANNEQVTFNASLCLDENSVLEICQLRVEAIEAINAYTQIKKEALKTNPEIWALDDLTALEEIEKEAEDIRGAKLLEIWGLGSWSLAMWELFVRRDSDIWSDQDLVLRLISQRFALEDNINRYELIRSASPFRSFLSLYCWRFNDAQKKTN